MTGTIGILLKKLTKHYIIVLFVALYVLFAFFTYKQYGITSDEQLDYANGKLLLEYFSKPTSPTTTLEAVLKMDQKSQLISSPLFAPYGRIYLVILNLLNPLGYYEQFHLLNMLFSTILFVIIYYVVYGQSKNQYLAVLGPVFLILSPSYIGQIPANAKDIPFAIFYFMSVIAVFYFSKKEITFGSILVLGFLFGITQSLRVIGFSIYIIYLLNIFIFERKHFDWKFLQGFVLTGVMSLFIMTSFWPYIGMNFFQNLKSVLVNSSFFYLWDKQILFMGEFLFREARPWYYLPMWFLITTPIYLLVLFVIPFVLLKRFSSNKLILYLYLVLAINFAIYLILKPVIYNGIRHFLFFIPLMVTIAALTFSELYKSLCCKNVKIFLITLLALGLLPVIFNITSLFPYHYVYFNELVGGTSKAYKNFDLDYWGASYSKAAEYVRDNFSSDFPKTTVYACNNGFAVDYYSYKKFEVTTSREAADYIICDVTSDMRRKYSGEIVYTLSKDSTPFIYIKKNAKK